MSAWGGAQWSWGREGEWDVARHIPLSTAVAPCPQPGPGPGPGPPPLTWAWTAGVREGGAAYSCLPHFRPSTPDLIGNLGGPVYLHG